jgi:hypothetical protein
MIKKKQKKKQCQSMLTHQARDPSHLTKSNKLEKNLKFNSQKNQMLKDEIKKKQNLIYKRIKNSNYKKKKT